jgi:hypothetical protein
LDEHPVAGQGGGRVFEEWRKDTSYYGYVGFKSK